MLYEGTELAVAIERQVLPPTLEQLFGDLYDPQTGRFLLQETTLIDFKEAVPESFSEGYGAGIVRLALALHNTFGGVIVFGVVDRTLVPVATENVFNVEGFNRYLSDLTGVSIECVYRRYYIDAAGARIPIQVILVPRRRGGKPVRLKKPLAKYEAGTLWIRDRHEVLAARGDHLPLLYSERSIFTRGDDEIGGGLHRSLPSSPATMEEFIGRWELMLRLWDWLTSSDQPRLYLHGPGGSGKSTLAYAFSRQLADSAQPIINPGDTHYDYVVYLSGKETAFNPVSGQSEAFLARDFSTAEQQYRQLLYHSGLVSSDDMASLNDEMVEARLNELFDHFSGLIIIDDIDALSRRGEDTGEELLLLKAARAGCKTKLLYTSRYSPPYALKSAVEVPGLRMDLEFVPFVRACCEQFDVPFPSEKALETLALETDKLPLLIETIIGLRRTCSAYEDAIRSYKDREGDAARRYLYRREYDRLEQRGKARQVLCALAITEDAVSSTNIAHITSLSESQVRDAITETRGIFLRTSQTEGGDTLYAVTQPSLYFLQQVSQSLAFYPALHQAVQYFKRQSTRTTPHQAAIITSLTNLARSGQYPQLVEQATSIPQTDIVWASPRFLGLLGQGYAHLGGMRSEDARECFRRAFALHSRDIFMLRAWYHLEFQSPNGADAAEKLCREVLGGDLKLEKRHLSEFHSKLGQVLEFQARSHAYTNRERAISLLKESLSAYFEGTWLGRGVRGLDTALQLEWLTDAARKLYRLIGNEIDHVFQIMDGWAETGHDVDVDAARIIVEPLRRAALAANPATRRIGGLARKTMSKLGRSKAVPITSPGFAYVNDTLAEIVSVGSSQA